MGCAMRGKWSYNHDWQLYLSHSSVYAVTHVHRQEVLGYHNPQTLNHLNALSHTSTSLSTSPRTLRPHNRTNPPTRRDRRMHHNLPLMMFQRRVRDRTNTLLATLLHTRVIGR